MNAIIGKNLKELRDLNRFSQDQVAEFLGEKRSTYANYEAGLREAPFEVLEKISHLYGCELHVILEENSDSFQDMLVCAFRVDNLSNSDFNEIANFKDIVKSYLKMDRLKNV